MKKERSKKGMMNLPRTEMIPFFFFLGNVTSVEVRNYDNDG